MISLIVHPHGAYRLGDFLIENLKDTKWTDFHASVAFVKKSGTQFIHSGLKGFASKKKVSISVGIDHGGSSQEGLSHLLDAVGSKGGVWVYKNSANTFHPKVYLFKNRLEADAIIGSGNLTKGGLFENAELGVRLKLNLTVEADKLLLKQLESILNSWSTTWPKICLPLDSGLLSSLVASGDVPTEQQAASAMKAAKAALQPSGGKAPSPFGSAKVQRAPSLPPLASTQLKSVPIASASVTTSGTSSLNLGQTFGITLQNTDVGHGQITANTAARSPELFIPMGAFDLNPAFWGWTSKSKPDSSKYKADSAWRLKNKVWIKEKNTPSRVRPLDKLDWPVLIKLKGHSSLVEANFGFNPKKIDIRMRADALRDAGTIGDILLIRQASSGAAYQYEMEVISKSTTNFGKHLAKLTSKVKSPSVKQYGYF